MEKRSSNKLLNGVIFLMAIAMFVMGAFIYIKGNKETKENDEKEETEVVTIKELSESDVTKLVDKYFSKDIPYIFKNINNYGLTYNYKMEITLLNTSEYTTEYKCSDLFEVSGVYGTYLMTPDSKSSWGCMDTDILNAYKYDDVNKEYQELFGKNNTVEKVGFNGDPAFDYSEKTDMFVVLKPAFNDTFLKEHYYYEVKSFNQEEENVEVTISYLSYSLVDRDKYEVRLNQDVSYESENVAEIKTYFEENKDDAFELTLKFKYEDDHFILIG